jgi:hypothetical protein
MRFDGVALRLFRSYVQPEADADKMKAFNQAAGGPPMTSLCSPNFSEASSVKDESRRFLDTLAKVFSSAEEC